MKLQLIKKFKISLPLFIWLFLLFLTTFYLHGYLYSQKFSYLWLVTFAEILLSSLLYFYRLSMPNASLWFWGLISLFYIAVCQLYQMAAIILMIGFFPIILTDFLLSRLYSSTLAVALLSILGGYTFVFLNHFYHLISTLISFDGIFLLTGILSYYTHLIAKLISERKKNLILNQQLGQAYHGLEKMVISRERNNFAQTLHDTVTQDLIAIGVNLEGIENQLPEMSLPEISTKLNKLRGFTDQSQKKLRQQINKLKSLETKIKRQKKQIFLPIIESFKQKFHLKVIYSTANYNLRLKAAVELSKIVTELLNNVVRHAQSDEVIIISKVIEKRYQLTITDFGRGMSQKAWNSQDHVGHFGLTAIKNNVRDMEGTFKISSAKGEGTTVVLSLPKGVAINE